jgi:hypothetical protein
METSIDYRVSGLDKDIERLLLKLEPRYPADMVSLEIAGKFLTPFKIYVAEKLQGIILCRRMRDYEKKEIIIIDHVVSEDYTETNFSEILARSLFIWANALGFDYVHQHADRPALARMLEVEYGQPSEWIFKKDLKSWAKAQVHQVQAKQPQATRQM